MLCLLFYLFWYIAFWYELSFWLWLTFWQVSTCTADIKSHKVPYSSNSTFSPKSTSHCKVPFPARTTFSTPWQQPKQSPILKVLGIAIWWGFVYLYKTWNMGRGEVLEGPGSLSFVLCWAWGAWLGSWMGGGILLSGIFIMGLFRGFCSCWSFCGIYCLGVGSFTGSFNIFYLRFWRSIQFIPESD